METMSDLGVTGLLEMPPAGTLTGIAKRALKGVETFALKTPDQLDDARAFVRQARRGASRHRRRSPTWRMVVSPGKGTFHRTEDIEAPTIAAEPQHRRRGREPARRDTASPRRTAAASSSGSSRTATSSPPASRCSACTPR